MLNGIFYRNRHRFAALAERFPKTTKKLIKYRWRGWVALGWPIFALSIVLYILHVWIIQAVVLVPWVPWVAAFNLTIEWTSEFLVLLFTIPAAVVAASVVFVLRLKWKTISEKLQPALEWWPALIGAWWVFAMIYAAIQTGPILGTLMPFMIPLAWAVDAIYGRTNEEHRVRKLSSEFRREMPVVFAILAAKSPSIQSLDQDTESTVEDIATDRPILEAPPMGLFPSIDGRVVEWPIARTPGRTLPETQKILDELAAAYPTVADHRDSIEMIWNPEHDKSRFASEGILRVTFKTREETSPLGLLQSLRQKRLRELVGSGE